MQEYLPFLVIGLASGSIYAIAAMGLVVTYKTSGVFNFAHGAVGMVATFIFYTLRVDAGVPTWLAAAWPSSVVAPLIGVVIDRLLLRRLRGAPASSYVVVSLGLLVGPAGPGHRHLRAGHPVGGADLLPGDVPAAGRQRRLGPGDPRGHLAGLGAAAWPPSSAPGSGSRPGPWSTTPTSPS